MTYTGAHAEDLAEMEHLLSGEVFARATSLHAVLRQASTAEQVTLTLDNLADLNDADRIRVLRCLVVRLMFGDLSTVAPLAALAGKAPVLVLHAEELADEVDP